MKRWVWVMTVGLALTVLAWGIFPLWRQAEAVPTPTDTTTPSVPEAAPFSLLCVFVDDEMPTGMHLLQFEATGVTVTVIPANARLVTGSVFTSASRLCTAGRLIELCAALEKQWEITIDNYAILSYDFYIDLIQTYFGGVTLTLDADVPVPFIGNTLVLPAGRQTLTPAQVVAYWRQSADPLETARRQGQVLAACLESWLTAAHRADWDALFADLTNTAVTDWRVDRYTVQRRTLWALSQSEEPLTVPFFLPAGEVVGEGAAQRFEFAD